MVERVDTMGNDGTVLVSEAFEEAQPSEDGLVHLDTGAPDITLGELLELPGRLQAARRSWKMAKKLYDSDVINYEELLAIRAGVRAILGLPVDA